MISAVDTNVLLDILIPNAKYLNESLECVSRAAEVGNLIIGEMVFAELSAQFTHLQDLNGFLSETSLRVQPSNDRVLHEAGKAWRAYTGTREERWACPACGKISLIYCSHCRQLIPSRRHIISDFLIGARTPKYWLIG